MQCDGEARSAPDREKRLTRRGADRQPYKQQLHTVELPRQICGMQPVALDGPATIPTRTSRITTMRDPHVSHGVGERQACRDRRLAGQLARAPGITLDLAVIQFGTDDINAGDAHRTPAGLATVVATFGRLACGTCGLTHGTRSFTASSEAVTAIPLMSASTRSTCKRPLRTTGPSLTRRPWRTCSSSNACFDGTRCSPIRHHRAAFALGGAVTAGPWFLRLLQARRVKMKLLPYCSPVVVDLNEPSGMSHWV